MGDTAVAIAINLETAIAHGHPWGLEKSRVVILSQGMAHPIGHLFLPLPKAIEPLGVEGGISDGVSNIPVAKVILD